MKDDLDEIFETRSTRSRRRSRTQRQPQPRRRGLGRRVWFLLAVIALIVVGPTIVGALPIRQAIIDMVAPPIHGRVTVGDAWIGWFWSTRLGDVRLLDEHGQVVCEVAEVRSDKSLLGWIFGGSLGTIELERLRLNLELRSNGSNIEDILAPLLAQPSTGAAPVGVVTIAGGAADIHCADDSSQWSLNQIDGQLELGSPQAPLVIALTSHIAQGSTELGEMRITSQFGSAGAPLEFDSGQVAVVGRQIPLPIAATLASRFVTPLRAAGLLSGELVVAWSDAGRHVDVRLADASATAVTLTAPQYLGPHALVTESLRATGQLIKDGGDLSAHQLSCETDFGRLSATGRMSLDELPRMATLSQLPAHDFQFAGEVDLAKAAVTMPQLVRIRPGVVLHAGRLEFQGAAQNQPADGRRLVAQVRAHGLAAESQGQAIRLDQPLAVAAALTQAEGTTRLESLDCQVAAVRLQAQASRDAGQLVVQGDLAQAIAQLRQIFDLGGIELEGQVQGNVRWQTNANTQLAANAESPRAMTIDGRVQVVQPRIFWPGRMHWQQPEVVMELAAAGSASLTSSTGLANGDTTPQSWLRGVDVNSGRLRLAAGSDVLDVQLAQPIDGGQWNGWAADVNLTGSIRSWLAQVGWLLPSGLPSADGELNVSTRIAADGDRIRCENVKYNIERFRMYGYGLVIDEPRVLGDGEITLMSDGTMSIDQATLVSSTIAARADGLAWRGGPQGFQLAGRLALRGDVGRLTRSIDALAGGKVQWFGEAQASLNLASDGSVVTSQMDLIVDNLKAATLRREQAANGAGAPVQLASDASAWNVLLTESQVRAAGDVAISRDLRDLYFRGLQLQSSALAIEADGAISDLAGARIADVRGQWTPNWDALNGVIAAYTGGQVNIQGGGPQTLTIEGPLGAAVAANSRGGLVDERLAAATAVEWRGGQVMGMPLGAGRYDVTLKNGVARMRTAGIPLAGGRLMASPRINLAGERPILVLDAGPVVDKVQLTPEICRSWLKFVAPLLADATSASGQMSVETSGLRLPLGGPLNPETAMVLTVHQAQIGPGPLGQQILTLASRVESIAKGQPLAAAAPPASNWLVITEQRIAVTIKDGRVHHQGLVLVVGDTRIVTSGSVGLDQSLNLVADIPIDDSWIAGKPWLAGLRGQSLRVPIAGTLSSPRLDNQLVQQFATQMFGQAAASAAQDRLGEVLEQQKDRLQNELIKGLDNWLAPKDK